MRTSIAFVLLAACGSKSTDDLCSRAVTHILGLTVRGPVADGERQVLDKVRTVSLQRCRTEGLTQAQADCILAVTSPDWDAQLRACPAFAERPSSWITLRPAVPDRGPRETTVSYREIVGTWGTTCGVSDAGTTCWGNRIQIPTAATRHLRIAGTQLCGLDDKALITCGRADQAERVPREPMHDFALSSTGGCGLRAADRTLVCWSETDEEERPPDGAFAQIEVAGSAMCARRDDGSVACVNHDPPPDGVVWKTIALRGRGACGIRADHMLECWGDPELGRPPAGTYAQLSCGDRGSCCALTETGSLACFGEPLPQAPDGLFSRVAVMRGHACVVRTTGGTVCWGDNEDGQSSPPQSE